MRNIILTSEYIQSEPKKTEQVLIYGMPLYVTIHHINELQI